MERKILKIDNLGINGEGVAKEFNNIYFIPKALPNELAEFEIVKKVKNINYCKLIKIIEKSKDRIESVCPYFDNCGGCDFLHFNYLATLKFKQDLVKDTLKKIAGLDVDVLEVEPSKSLSYRNKMTFNAIFDEKGLSFGMFESGSKNQVKIKKCMIAKDLINRILVVCNKFFSSSEFMAYDYSKNIGDVKFLSIRIINEIPCVTVVTTKDIKNVLSLLYKELCKINLNAILWENINLKFTSEIFSDMWIKIGGNDIENESFGIIYSVHPYSFMQINDDIREKIYNEVLNNINKDDIVLDGYSGAGFLSGLIARKCKKVIGVEINKNASFDAEKMKKRNNIKNLTNYNGDCVKLLPKILVNNAITTLILDPPKSGVNANLIKKINESNINKIIYIACGLTTLARDLNELKKNYKVLFVKPYDMFANTANIETMVVLSRK